MIGTFVCPAQEFPASSWTYQALVCELNDFCDVFDTVSYLFVKE